MSACAAVVRMDSPLNDDSFKQLYSVSFNIYFFSLSFLLFLPTSSPHKVVFHTLSIFFYFEGYELGIRKTYTRKTLNALYISLWALASFTFPLTHYYYSLRINAQISRRLFKDLPITTLMKLLYSYSFTFRYSKPVDVDIKRYFQTFFFSYFVLQFYRAILLHYHGRLVSLSTHLGSGWDQSSEMCVK